MLACREQRQILAQLQQVLPLAPLTLPYSPEFEPRIDPSDGRNTLGQLARDSGGIERTEWDDVFAGRLRHRQIRELVWPLALLLLALHVAEIAGRALSPGRRSFQIDVGPRAWRPQPLAPIPGPRPRNGCWPGSNAA